VIPLEILYKKALNRSYFTAGLSETVQQDKVSELYILYNTQYHVSPAAFPTHASVKETISTYF